VPPPRAGGVAGVADRCALKLTLLGGHVSLFAMNRKLIAILLVTQSGLLFALGHVAILPLLT